MSRLHRRVYPSIIIALLTAWSFLILAAPPFGAASSSPYSLIIPQTGQVQTSLLSTKVGQDSHPVDPSSRFSRVILSNQAQPTRDSLPTLSSFARQVDDGRELIVREVYVPEVLALPVVQQPIGKNTYVSESLGTITQFQMAALNNVIGLLAHNYLSGSLFSKLEIGQDVYAVMGNGAVHRFKITGIHKFQKKAPANPNSSYVELKTGKQLSMPQVFRRFYQGDHRIVFQTCLEKNGNLVWGMVFIQAEPAPAPILTLYRGLNLH